MTKTLCTCTCLFFTILGACQIYTPDTNSYKSFIKIELDINYENNALNNDFVDLLFSNEFIPRETRESNLKELRNQNQFGINIIQKNEAYLGMLDPFKERFGLKVGFDWRYSLYADYNRDLYELIFIGNSQLQNSNATLHTTNINEFNYQRLTFGLYDEISTSYINLAIGKGSHLRQASFTNANVLTGNQGQFLDLDWKGEYSNTTSSKFADWNGTSVSADIKWNIVSRPSKSRDFMNILSLEVSHLGFMRWTNLKETNIDTTFRFTGLELGDFLDDSFQFPTQSAIEDSILPSSVITKYTQFLPFHLNLSASSLRSSGISYGFELDHWVNSKSDPNFRFLLGYLFRRNFKLNSEYSVGGYQRAKIGFSFEWEINYSWYWKVGTHHFVDNFDKNGLGRSIFVTLKRDIR